MILEVAGPTQDEELRLFYSQFPVTGHVDLKLKRLQSYFSPYQIQSEQHVTYLIRDPKEVQGNDLLGTASFVIQDVYLNKKITTVAFGRDLRVQNSRRAVMGWTQHFLPVMEDLKRKHKIEHFFSVLNLMESKALNAFVRPRPTKRPLPRYFLFRRYNLVSTHGRFPWVKNPLPHLKIRHGSPQYLDALMDYIIRKSLDRDLGTTWDAESFSAKLSRWTGLRLDDFLIAFDKDDNVVGCTAPWSSAQLEEKIPLEYSLRGHNFRQFLKFGQFMGWSRALTKPSHRLEYELPLNFKYLCFLNCDNEDIFESLLWRAYAEASPKEFLVYARMLGDYMIRPPNGWFCSESPNGIYLMLLPGEEPPNFLRPTNDRVGEVEPFFT